MLLNLGYPMMFLRWSSNPVTVTFFLAVIFHLLLDQVFAFSISREPLLVHWTSNIWIVSVKILMQKGCKIHPKFFKPAQVTSTYTLHISIGVPLVGVLVASLLLNKDAVVYLTKKFGNLLNWSKNGEAIVEIETGKSKYLKGRLGPRVLDVKLF